MFDDFVLLYDEYVVCYLLDYGQVMVDEQIGQVVVYLQLCQQVQYLCLDVYIQCVDCFVQYDQCWVDDDGVGKGDVLLLFV